MPDRDPLWRHIQPVFILSAPRAGSTLLFELLTRYLPCLSVGGESHGIFAHFPSLRMENEHYNSGCLHTAHATSEVSRNLRDAFACQLHYSNRRRPDWEAISRGSSTQIFIEKTPRNALNIPFLLRVFPNAKFIYLYRHGLQNIASLIEGWHFGQQTGHFVTFPDLPGFAPRKWCFLLPPEWREHKNKAFSDIAAFQWQKTNSIIQDQLGQLATTRWTTIDYQELIDSPHDELTKLAEFCQLTPFNTALDLQTHSLPLSATTLSAPDSEKWRRFASELSPYKTAIAATMSTIRTFAEKSALKENK